MPGVKPLSCLLFAPTKSLTLLGAYFDFVSIDMDLAFTLVMSFSMICSSWDLNFGHLGQSYWLGCLHFLFLDLEIQRFFPTNFIKLTKVKSCSILFSCPYDEIVINNYDFQPLNTFIKKYTTCCTLKVAND